MTENDAVHSAPKTARPADRVNRWLSLAANIGVVLGLFILIIEVRQNTTLSRLALETQSNEALTALEFELASPHGVNAWVASVRNPHEMTDQQIRLIESHLVAVMQHWDSYFDMEEAGLVTRDRVTSHIRNSAPFYFGSAHAKNWWHLQKPGWETTAMYEVAGPIIDSLDPDFILDNLNASRLPPPSVTVPPEPTP